MDSTMHVEAVKMSNATESPQATQEPVQAKGLVFLVLYGVANMTIGVGTIAVATVLLPRHVASFTHGNQTGIFSLIIGIGAVAAVLTHPLVGMLSDRTTSRWGRRRPWLIAGGLLTVVTLLLLASATSLLAVTLEWICLQIGINSVQVALTALLPDQIPLRQRATVSAFAAGLGILLGGLCGQIIITQFSQSIPMAYIAIAVTISIMLGIFLPVLHDIPLSQKLVSPRASRPIGSWFSPMTQPDFALTWLARCLMFLGYTTVVNFMFYFLQDTVHYSHLFPGHTTTEGVQTLFAINVGSVLVTSLLAGVLSDKLQRRKAFVIASGLTMMIGLLIYAFLATWPMVIVATVILGLGTGAFLSVDLALASQVLPTATDRGKDIGLINTATFLPMILSPLMAGIVLGTSHSYPRLFVLLAAATLLAALLILPLKTVR